MDTQILGNPNVRLARYSRSQTLVNFGVGVGE